MRTNALLLSACLLLVMGFSGCMRKGEDDPFISFRSRDARLKNDWKMNRMETTIAITTTQPGNVQQRLVYTSIFDGRNMTVRLSGNDMPLDTVFGYTYTMRVKDDGKLDYTYSTILGGLAVRSDGEEQWFWISDDRKKAKVYLGNAIVAAATAGFNLPVDYSFLTAGLMREFNVQELRNKDLVLTYNKVTRQTNIDGSFQEVTISNRTAFKGK